MGSFSILALLHWESELKWKNLKIEVSIIAAKYPFLKNEVGGACSAYGGRERRVQGFGGEIWGKETTGETQTRMGYNIKVDLHEVGYRGMDWIELAQVEGHVADTCECGNEPSGSI
jgi:hypothetical protein